VVNFVESPDTVFENLREISPTVFIGVPRTWEKLYSTTIMALQDATPLQRWIYRRAISVGEAVADCKLAHRPVPLGLRLLRQVAEWVALGNTKRMLGLGRCRLIGSGAAPISPDAIRWYLALGLEMVELYGQTECGGVATVYPPEGIQLGTVGPAIPGTEVRIAEDGEILVRSPGVFPGYRNKPEKTAEALRDGWLHTGDIGTMAADGYLRITDRKSDIMITSGGKNITPTEIENKLKFSPYITDAVVIGDARKFLTCLVMIDHDIVAKYIQEKRIPFTDYASLTRLPAVRTLIGEEIEKSNASLNNVESIKKFALIDVLLTAEDEEMTPTLKLRRKYVNEKYRDLIESMYRGPG
jgi:long-chain acyl-CoA synthetase